MNRRSAAEAALVVAIVAGAVAYVVSTYPVLSATADEPLHLAAGLEWLGGSYGIQPPPPAPGAPAPAAAPSRVAVVVDPPLARVALAAGPYLGGLRASAAPGPRGLLYQGAGYDVNLRRARLGGLPFLVLAIGLTWVLGRRLFGRAAGVASATALGTLPVVLGHAGLATTDVPGAAMFLVATLAVLWWLGGDAADPSPTPSWTRTLVLGAALGMALATKLTALALIPAAILVALYRRRCLGAASAGTQPKSPAARGQLAGRLAVAGGIAGLLVWAAYRFSFGRPSDSAGPALFRSLVDGCFDPGARAAAARLLSVPVPAPELLDGMLVLCGQNRPGHTTSFLLGHISQQGFPLFFPVALLVKAPLPFLALAGAGIVAAARRPPAARWRTLAPGLIGLVFLALMIPSRINVGVRHLMPLFPLLAIYAGAGATALWRTQRHHRITRPVVIALGAWLLVTPARAAPDHLAWFNVLAGAHPEAVLLDSNLDWGQDLRRLEAALASRHVPSVSLAYFGPAELCRHALPPGRWLRPHERAVGWIAISEMYRRGVVGFYYRNGDYCDGTQLVGEAPPDPTQYAWLDAYTPVARVGRSILLYDIPEGTAW